MSVTRFRPELEGLRGVAVLIAIAGHAGAPLVGAIGPDLFFVLSGYLIAGILLRNHATGAPNGFGQFYARRFRRIVPALIVSVILTVGAVAWIGDASLLRATAADAQAALLGVGNIHFAVESMDYFAADVPSPLLPLWSIGVEEQFYLIAPILIAVALRGGRRWVGALFAALAVGSTIAAVFLTQSDPVWAYYLLPTRAYAIALGVLVAVAEPTVIKRLRGLPMAPVAAATIAVGVMGAVGAPYPGSLGPVIACAGAILILGLRPDVRGGAALTRVASSTPLRLLGRISYSLYLVHFPFLVLPPLVGVTMTAPVVAAAIGGALIVATACYLLVEQPFRAGRWIGLTPGRTIGSVGTAVLAIVLGASALTTPPPIVAVATELPIIVLPTRTPTPTAQPGSEPPPRPWEPISIAGTTTHLLDGPVPADLRPSLAEASGNSDNVVRSGCGLAHEGTTPPVCVRGLEGGRRIVIFGDSHASHWVPGIERAAAAYGWEIRPVTKVNCGPVNYSLFAERIGRMYRECDAWREAAIAMINKLEPALVLLSSVRFDDPSVAGDSLQHAIDGVTAVIDRIEAPVAIIGNNPFSQINLPTCLRTNRSQIAACAPTRQRTDYSHGYKRDRRLAEQRGLPFIDPMPALCPGERCAPIIDGIVVYHDHHHLTVTMSRHLAGPLGAAIDQIIAAVAR